MRLSRFHYQPPPPWAYSSLRPPPKVSLTKRHTGSRYRGDCSCGAHRGSEASEVAPAAPTEAPSAVAGAVPTWQALLDVTVWRSRPWWLRVAASLVVKRLNR